jgi:hypothetical protein
MSRIIFSHPTVDKLMSRNKTPGGQSLYRGDRICIQDDGSLHIWTGANQIKWGYNLNTVTYPTYGGEVVQILSANISDLTVGGDVRNYTMMEDIYLWFMVYMSVATQGWRDAGSTGHNEEPVTMWYPEREWQFQIRPKAIPGLHIGTEVVAPTWQMTAAVIQGDPDAEALTLKGAIEGLNEIHAGVGYEEYNPFSAPTNKKEYQSMQAVGKIGTELDRIFSDFSAGDFDYLTKPYISGPPKGSQDK